MAIKVFVENPVLHHKLARVGVTAWRRFVGTENYGSITPDQVRTVQSGGIEEFDLGLRPGLWTIGVVYSTIGRGDGGNWSNPAHLTQDIISKPAFLGDQEVRFTLP